MGTRKKKNVGNSKLQVCILIAVLVVAVLVFALFQVRISPKPKPEIITVSTLKEIINVSELSTFTAMYNGIAEVKNEKNPEKTDYYVSYKAKVNAGIDFNKVEFDIDDSSKIVTVKIPKVYITGVSVDIASLDFIFYNEKANSPTVTQQAYKLCEADVQDEVEKATAICELAQKNAVDVIIALVRPIIEQLNDGYTLAVK